MKHNDGIIKFHEKRHHVDTCPVCKEETLVWDIKDHELPEGIEPSHKLILFEQHPSPPGYSRLRRIGIGCGCYARFHRQISHIQDRMKRKAS